MTASIPPVTQEITIRSYNCCGLSSDACVSLVKDLVGNTRQVLMAQETFLRSSEYENPNQIQEHEFTNGSKMWSGGLALHRQTAIPVSADIRQCIEVVTAWSHGISLDCTLDAIPTRLISAHLPNSWRPLHELAEALMALDRILAEAAGAGKRIVLAGDLNVELGAFCDHQRLGESRNGVPTAKSLEVAGADHFQTGLVSR
eukprot:698287-Amphidinium_carterae.2